MMLQELRIRRHHPLATVGLIFVAVVIAFLEFGISKRLLGAPQTTAAQDTTFAKLPKGWTAKSTELPRQKVAAIGSKLGGNAEFITNTIVSDGKRQVQINVIGAHTQAAAQAIIENLSKAKQNNQHVQLKERRVYEFVCRTDEQARFALEAMYRLPIAPKTVKYEIAFDAAPLASCDPMSWNKLYSTFMAMEAKGSQQAELEKRIQNLSSRFEFGSAFDLKSTGQGSVATDWKLTPQPQQAIPSAAKNSIRFEFGELPMRMGVPFVHIEGQLTSTAFAHTPVAPGEDTQFSLRATDSWPVADTEIQALAKRIVGAVSNQPQKLKTIMAWLGDPANLRVGGETGSRYGVSKVVEQRFGNCWDYSDLFITLCRASGIPARQVFGWLHRGEGHVWSEVLLDDHWLQVDATTSYACGSHYIPLIVSRDGAMPLVYVSSIKITPIP